MQRVILDIGSNSIRSMQAEITPQGVFCFPKQVCTTRLADGLAQTGRLSQAAMDRTCDAICRFVQQAQSRHIPCAAYATSAVRDAKNGSAFVQMVQQRCGVAVAVLSGETEARLALLGAAGEGGLIDIGGGSIQVVTGEVHESRPMGCVRLRDLTAGLPPQQQEQAVRQRMQAQDWPCPAPSRWVGVGGTITTLAAFLAGLTDYDPAVVRQTVLTKASLAELIGRLRNMGDSRKEHPLLRSRHDTILPGAYALGYLMDHLSISTLAVSDADGMEGYLLHLLRQEEAQA